MRIASLKIHHLCCASLFCLLSCATTKADSITFTPNSGTAGDGQTFSFTFTLTTTHPFYGLSLYLESSAASSFSVTGETSSGNSPITDPNFVGAFPVLLSTSANSPDFGYTSTGTHDISAGVYVVGTISLATGSSVPRGTFSITTTTGVNGSEYNDAEGDIYQLPQATFTVSVPEAGGGQIVCGLAAFAVLFQICARPHRRHSS